MNRLMASRNRCAWIPRMVFVLLIWLNSLSGLGQELKRFEFAMPIMGTRMDLVMYASSQIQAEKATESFLDEVRRLSRIVSNYDEDSEISKLCKNAYEKPVELSLELQEVLAEAEKWRKLSQGSFDVTIGPLTSLWRAARKQNRLPLPFEIEDARKRVGFDKVIFASGSRSPVERVEVRFAVDRMYLDLSGLATGYILDVAVQKIRQNGIVSFLINIGGDICLGDAPPGQAGWRVDVGSLGQMNRPVFRLDICNCSVTTSGDLYQYVEIDGRRYSHFIDPKTCAPIERRQSVTVVSNTTLDADAGATTLALLGFEKAVELHTSFPLTRVYWLEASGGNDSTPRFRVFEP